MAQFLLPGYGDVDETGSGQYLLPGYGDTNESVSSGVSGSSATTNANDTAAASGTTTVIGTAGTTNASDVCAASGSVGSEVFGSSATTNANDVSAASGTTTVAGAAACTNVSDIAAASGVAGSVSGSAACVNAADLCAAFGSVPQQQGGSSGGFFEVPQVRRHRTVREERERLGIITSKAKTVVIAVARASVVEHKTDDQAERQLAQRLQQQNIEATALHQAAMMAERDRLLNRDIERALRIRRRRQEMEEDERDVEILLM